MLRINSIIVYGNEHEKKYERLLFIHGDICYFINIYGNSMPRTRLINDTQAGIDSGDIILLDTEPYIIVQMEDEIVEDHKTIRDKAYNAIKDIILIEPDIYVARERAKLVRQLVV